jgi:hypothetical protein
MYPVARVWSSGVRKRIKSFKFLEFSKLIFRGYEDRLILTYRDRLFVFTFKLSIIKGLTNLIFGYNKRRRRTLQSR